MQVAQNIVIALILAVTPIQLFIFIGRPGNGESVWRSYVASWMVMLRTFKLLFLGASNLEQRMSFLAWVWIALCIPELFIICYVLHGVTDSN